MVRDRIRVRVRVRARVRVRVRAASMLTMNGPTQPGSGMCRKASEKPMSSSLSSCAPRPMVVIWGRAATPRLPTSFLRSIATRGA